MVTTMMTITAQTALKKVYNENIDPMEQIDKALVNAKAEGKYVVIHARLVAKKQQRRLPSLCNVLTIQPDSVSPYSLCLMPTARCCTHKTQVFLRKKRATAKRRC